MVDLQVLAWLDQKHRACYLLAVHPPEENYLVSLRDTYSILVELHRITASHPLPCGLTSAT